MTLSKKLDHSLLNLAWSLWTELGLRGVKRNHQNVLILLEELILLTASLAEIDPRLRDESLDWCSQYHHFVSISRLKSLITDSDTEPFSRYSASLNAISRAAWPVFTDAAPWKVKPSHKSCLQPLESPALLNIRIRAIFGTGARADLITFFLIHKNSDFSISDVTAIGYSKRNLAEILEDLNLGKLFDKFMQGNQLRYRLIKNDQLLKAIKPIPKYTPSWRLIFKLLLSLRNCIRRTENSSESTKVVEIRNCLKSHQETLQRLRLSPPSFQSNFQIYLQTFSDWLLALTKKLADGNFPDASFLSSS